MESGKLEALDRTENRVQMLATRVRILSLLRPAL